MIEFGLTLNWLAQAGPLSVFYPALGVYRIEGNVSRLGVSGVHLIGLLERTSKTLVRRVYSDADGKFLFEAIPFSVYALIAFDDTSSPVNAAISDYVTPEPM